MRRRVDRRDADDVCPVGMGGGGLGVPNLCALTRLPPHGQLRGVSLRLVVGGLHHRRAVVAGGGPAARQAVKARVNEARYAVCVGSEAGNNFDFPG